MSDEARKMRNAMDKANPPPTYWLSFRIDKPSEDDPGYNKRRNDLLSVIDQVRVQPGKLPWDETTSFLIFRSRVDIATISGNIRNSIDPTRDQALLHELDAHNAVHIGVCTDPTLLTDYLFYVTYI